MFQELFAQISDETTIDEYIDFDFEIVTSEPAVNTQNVDWRQESRERSIAEVIHLEDLESGDEGTITLTVSEALESLDGVKNCTEVHGDNEMNMTLNDLIGRVQKLKLKTSRETNISSFLKKWNCKDIRGGSRINFRVLQNFTKKIEHRNDVICRKIIDSARSKKVQFWLQ